MAEGIVIYLVDKLSSLVTQEAKFLLGVEGQLLLLRDEFQFITSFLRDAEKKRRKSHLVEVWVTQIREVAYDAEDVIDAYMLHLEQQRSMNLFRKIFHKARTLRDIGLQIEHINTRARRISVCRTDYNIDVVETIQDPNTLDVASIRRGTPSMDELVVVGFKNELAQVVDLLNQETAHRQVISFIGMGGLGKTTLAQMVYRSANVCRQFDVRIWISVSQEYQLKDIFTCALKQVSGNSSGLETNEELKEELWRQLNGQKYLVVIDDVWKVEAWDQITGAFPNNTNASRVVLTTRIKEVALRADPSSHNHLHLRFLNKDESWELFCNKVFLMPDATCPSELVNLGKDIVDKCGGLPIAIVVLGGLIMGKERTRDAWSRVLESVNWYLSQDSNQCRQILILSYSDLPYYLKSCFLYLGLFPEDSLIYADKLIRLWIAEGFVQSRGKANMEDIAEDFLQELVQRSLIHVSNRNYHGGPVHSFRVHDLVRDLALSEGRKDRFLDIHTNNSLVSDTKPRRLAIHSSSTNDEETMFIHSATNLRCLLFFKEGLSSFPNGTKLLRVLDLEDMDLRKGLPKEIGELVFLHYLGLSSTGLTRIPSSIGNLLKLQTLDVRFSAIRVLPKSIWKLQNLRHLFMYRECVELEGVAGIKGFSRNLVTLEVTGSIWMNQGGTGLSESIVQHGCLRSLDIWGELVVKNPQNLRSCFPTSITELILRNTYIEEDPSDILGSLPKLKALYLSSWSLTITEMVFSRGGFPQLQYLNLGMLDSLCEWRVEDGSMAVVRHLQIMKLDNLKRLPYGLRNVDTVQHIHILNMPHMKERIKENGEDWDIIKHIPFVKYS